MGRYAMIFDNELCTGCRTCEVACKQENGIAISPSFISIVQHGPEDVGGKLFMSFSAVRCMHCGKPACVDACPVGAISIRADSIVEINSEQCNGCQACIEACPFAAPQFNLTKNIVEKCNLCASRVEKGLRPACVSTCHTGALIFGEAGEITQTLRVLRCL
jgi:Fe-S-cluster-containing dehydrogenase component